MAHRPDRPLLVAIDVLAPDDRYPHPTVKRRHTQSRSGLLENTGMNNPLWETLSAQARTRVDDLVMKGYKLQAVKAIREALEEPRPGLYECMDLVAERFEDLGQRFTRSPTAPLDLDELTAKVRALPHRPSAIEALWDGDSEGWMVDLLAVTSEPRAEASPRDHSTRDRHPSVQR